MLAHSTVPLKKSLQPCCMKWYTSQICRQACRTAAEAEPTTTASSRPQPKRATCKSTTTPGLVGLLLHRQRRLSSSSSTRVGTIFAWAEQMAAQHEHRDAVHRAEQAHRQQRRKRAARGNIFAPAAKCPFELRARSTSSAVTAWLK